MRLLSPDSRFFQAVSKAADLVLVNLMVVLLSLPVVTAGAAVAGSYRSVTEMVTDSGSHPVRTMLIGFKQTFVRATAVWSGFLGLAVLLWWEWSVAGRLANPLLARGWQVLVLLVGLLTAITMLWYLPLVSSSDKGVLPLLKASLLAAIRYLPRTAMGLWFFLTGPILVVLSPAAAPAALVFALLVGPALCCYLFAVMIHTVRERVAQAA